MRLSLQRLLLAAIGLAVAAPALAQSGDAPADVVAEPDFAALAEMFPDGLPAPAARAAGYRLPPHLRPPERKLPTRIEYAEGALKWDLSTSVTTRRPVTTIVPALPDPYLDGGAAGGSGQLKGHVRYVGETWEFYGVQTFGAHQGDGAAPTLHEATLLGGLYKLPGAMRGGRIGASIELNSANERKTRVEYRQPFGTAEGFIAAEQTFLPAAAAHNPPAAIRAGVNRKF